MTNGQVRGKEWNVASLFTTRLGSRPRAVGIGLVFALVATMTPARALIGDTPEDLIKRYGAGKEVGNQLLYKIDNYSVSIYFDNQKSSMEIYSRLPRVDGTHEELTDEDVQKLLKLVGGNSQWNPVRSKKSEKTWLREDGKVIARLKSEEKAMVFVDARLK